MGEEIQAKLVELQKLHDMSLDNVIWKSRDTVFERCWDKVIERS